jgi:hypothetical protein
MVTPVVEQVVTDTANKNTATIADQVYGSDIVAGNFLIFTFHEYDTSSTSPTISAMSDTQGNTWRRARRQQGSVGNDTRMVVDTWFAENAAAGATTISITNTGDGSGHYWSAGILEVSGMSKAGLLVLDTSGGELVPSTSAADNTTVTADAASSQDDTLLIAVCNNNAIGTTGFTAPSGYTVIYDVDNGNTDQPGWAGYKVESAAETESASWTRSNGAWVSTISVFDALVAAPLDADFVRRRHSRRRRM